MDHLFGPCEVEGCDCAIFDPKQVFWPGGFIVLNDPPGGEPTVELDLPAPAADRVCELLRRDPTRPVPMSVREALWLVHLPSDVLGQAESPLFAAMEGLVDERA